MIVAALAVPILGLPLAWRAPTAAHARRWVGRLALGVAALWLVVLLTDAAATFGRFGAGAAPVGIGTWLLLASVTWPARRWPLALSVVAAGVCVGGASLLAGTGDLSDAGGALALAAAVVVLAARSEGDGGLVPATVAVAGAAVVAAGLVRLEGDTGGFAAGGGAVVAIGAAAVVLASGLRARRAGVVLLPLALVLGLQADTTTTTVAIAVAVVAMALTRKPGASLGLWAVAVASISPPAALLVGSSAVVSAAWLHPLAPVAALPGAAAAVYAATQDAEAGFVVLAFLAAETIVQLWRRDDASLVEGSMTPPTIAALAAGCWLLLAPATWAWADAPGLGSWGTGVLVALVAAAVAAFVVASFTDATFTTMELEVADPLYGRDPRLAWRVALVSLVILAISGARLVASVVS